MFGTASISLYVFLLLSFNFGGYALEDATQRFKTYLQIMTAHPDPDYGPPVEFLAREGKSIGLEVEIQELHPGKPLVLMTWPGTRPDLPSVLFNSHMDVVPVEEDKWTHPPFSADQDSEGNIYARGSQDMKSVGMQYLESVRALKREGYRPMRTLHLTFVPDEEIGGGKGGIPVFVNTQRFKALNVAFALDEGLSSPTPQYRVFYAERGPWQFVISARGAPGHGSTLSDNSAAENLIRSLGLVAAFRSAQFDLVKGGAAAAGEVISINLSYLKAGKPTPTGFVMNVQPSEAEAGFDMRVPPLADEGALERRMDTEWAPAARNMSYRWIQRTLLRDEAGRPFITATNVSNPWWGPFASAVTRAGGSLARPEIFPAATDGRYVRQAGIPVIGFSPIANTPILLHDHDEFLNEKEFLKGIDVYREVMKALSSVDFDESSGHVEL